MIVGKGEGSERSVIERAKELDHEHRLRSAGSRWGSVARVLTLRLFRLAIRRLFIRPTKLIPRPVPHPRAGQVAVTFVGHGSVMLTTTRSRILVDPFFAEYLLGIRRHESACLAVADAAAVDLILISHAHSDRLHGQSLRKLPRRATVVVPPRCGPLLDRLGFARVIELAPGHSLEHRDVEVMAVAARHDGRRGGFDRAWRSALGYIVSSAGASVYYAGDTAYFSGFEEIGRRMHPDVALLPIAGYEPPSLREDHMSPLDAVQAFEDLGAKLLVPIAYGSFPLGYEPVEEPLAWLTRLCRDRDLLDRLVVLRPGETCHVQGGAG